MPNPICIEFEYPLTIYFHFKGILTKKNPTKVAYSLNLDGGSTLHFSILNLVFFFFNYSFFRETDAEITNLIRFNHGSKLCLEQT